MRRIGAFYGRYSSDNQRVESIEDQLRVCLSYAEREGITVPDEYRFDDKAISGTRTERPGLSQLYLALRSHREITVILVDDLSRLSRNDLQMLTAFYEFEGMGIEIISVSDGFSSNSPNASILIYVKALQNKLYIDDNKHKIIRGIVGQLHKGRSGGEKTYGYKSRPVGEYVRKGSFLKPEGMIHEVEPDEAKVVVRIFEMYNSGRSPVNIAKELNKEGTLTRNGKNWSLSQIGRFLRNERYIGSWTWGKKKTIYHPITGKKSQVLRPENELLYSDVREHLRIVPQELWDSVQERLKIAEKPFPQRRSKQDGTNKSYVHAYPKHLFSGMMKCGVCGGTIMLVSGRREGYYGCHKGYKLGGCSNEVIIRKNVVDEAIVKTLIKEVMNPDALDILYKEVERLVFNYKGDVPEKMKEVLKDLNKVKQDIQNYMNFIREGNFSKHVGDALKKAEEQEENLERQKAALQQAQVKLFKAPPLEWIVSRLQRLHELLLKTTGESALLLRELLGDIVFTPAYPDAGKPYYIISSKIQTLALLKESKGFDSNSDPDAQGSNSICWWS